MYWAGQRNASRAYPELTLSTQGDRAQQIRDTTTMVAASFEPMIREHPADWHMLQRLWVADLDLARPA
jgi:KDO2-lipid IV(A) lauroyltransferase